MHRLGSLAAGVAGNMALDGARRLARGERADLRALLLTPRNAHRMADDLARMRGAAMKLGQLLSMEAGDVLPPELAEILARLRATADPMPPRQLRDVLNAEWGHDWRRRFAGFDTRPIAAASIGQVHRARLRDGRDLAIKVQYPGIARSIDSDVAHLGTLLRVAGLVPEGVALAPYLDEARRQLRLEADYTHEAAALAAYAERVADAPDFLLPAPVPELSTGRILAMQHIESRPIDSLVTASQAERDRVACLLIDLTLREIFTFRSVQTDPNFANYRYQSRSGRIVLLDFGATRSFGDPIVVRCRQLLRAGMAADGAALDAAAATLGLFPEKLADGQRARLVGMMEMVFAEMRDDTMDFGESSLLPRLRTEGEALAATGMDPPAPPIDLLYLHRKVAGMFLLATRLRARVPMRKLIAPYVASV